MKNAKRKIVTGALVAAAGAMTCAVALYATGQEGWAAVQAVVAIGCFGIAWVAAKL